MINMEASIEIERAGKRVNMENKTCSVGNDNNNQVDVVCFTFQACLFFTGINVDETKDFMLSYELDPKKLNRRLYFMRSPDRSAMEEVVRMRKGEELCRRHLVYLLVKETIKRKERKDEKVNTLFVCFSSLV